MSSSSLHRRVVNTGGRRGFTLIEVLVVVAIIALLVSVLMPALGAAKRQARVAVCAANLKTIGLGTQFYAQASKDELPAGYQTNASGRPTTVLDPASNTSKTVLAMQPWEFLHPHIQKVNMKQGTVAGSVPTVDGMVLQIPVYSCAEDIMQHTTSERIMNGKKVQMGVSYGANLLPLFKDSVTAVLFNTGDTTQVTKYLTRGAGKLSTIKSAASIVAYYDNGDDGDSIQQFRKTNTNEPRARWYLSDCKADFSENQCTFEARHKTGGNFAYMDGHVSYHSINHSGPYYGLPRFPTAWLPDYNPNKWDTSNPDLAWVKQWHMGTPTKAFLPPTSEKPLP